LLVWFSSNVGVCRPGVTGLVSLFDGHAGQSASSAWQNCTELRRREMHSIRELRMART
jgi:hypothetical protein